MAQGTTTSFLKDDSLAWHDRTGPGGNTLKSTKQFCTHSVYVPASDSLHFDVGWSDSA
jgi:hypothetical protein